MHQLVYEIGWSNPSSQLIEITFSISGNTSSQVNLQLPSWRPGRYELGNFAKNICHFKVEDAHGNPLPFEKRSKDNWVVACGNLSEFRVVYSYFAAELNAGSSYLDQEQLYVNPVNCCIYIPERMQESCLLKLKVPATYQVATDLPSGDSPFSYVCENFDRLADAPLIASANLQHAEFEESGHVFHLWFMGDVQPDWIRLEHDFRRFCKEQIQTMGALPGNAFHFLFQILPTAFYHGVEHTFSTVCALGPGNKVFNTEFYDELLGVSSHELFHAWNVKTIRPSEMAPYDFTHENYSQMGWVYEGITTWLGDQFLLRSGVFDSQRYLQTLNDKLKRHFISYGRFNQPVAEASFDTWLDGYVAGIPHRKTSIYVEGSLITFLMDSYLRENSQDRVSIDNLLRLLYADAKQGIPYSKTTILSHLQALSGYNFPDFYTQFIEGISDFEPELKRCFGRLGMQLETHFPFSEAEHRFGFRIQETGGIITILLLAPGSPAEASGMLVGDQLIACNTRRISQNWPLLSNEKDQMELHLFSKERMKTITLKSTDARWFSSRIISFTADPTPEQKNAYQHWSKQEFPA